MRRVDKNWPFFWKNQRCSACFKRASVRIGRFSGATWYLCNFHHLLLVRGQRLAQIENA